MDKTALRTVVLHKFKLGRTAAKTAANVSTPWGGDTMSDQVVFIWYSKLRNRNGSTEDNTRAERPSLIDQDDLKESDGNDPRPPL